MATAIGQKQVCWVDPELDGRLEYSIRRNPDNLDYILVNFLPGIKLHYTYPGGYAWRYNRWAAKVYVSEAGVYVEKVGNLTIKNPNQGEILNYTWYEAWSGEISLYAPDEKDISVRCKVFDTGYGWDFNNIVDTWDLGTGNIHTPENHSKVYGGSSNNFTKDRYVYKTVNYGTDWTKCDAYSSTDWGSNWTKIQ